MEHVAGIALRWAGRVFILLGVVVLVGSLFLPAVVQPLNSLVCPRGTELDNSRWVPPNSPDNSELDLVCTGPDHTESAAHEILLITIGCITLGLISLMFSQRLVRGHYRRPAPPTIH